MSLSSTPAVMPRPTPKPFTQREIDVMAWNLHNKPIAAAAAPAQQQPPADTAAAPPRVVVVSLALA